MASLAAAFSKPRFQLSLVITLIIFSGCAGRSLDTSPSKMLPGIQVTPTVIHTQVMTPSPVPTRTPKREPVLKPAITSTFTAAQATALGFRGFDLCQSQFDEKRVSPEKKWYLCEHGDPQGADIVLINVDGRRWSFSYREMYGIDYSGEIRYFKWTPDEAFLYFTVMEPWEMYGPFTANADALFRMDLQNGNITKILGTIDTFQPDHEFYIVSISPTVRRLAYSDGYNWVGTRPQTVLHIRDFQSGEEFSIPMDFKYYQLGDLTWSEDGLLLGYKLYSTGQEVCKYNYSIGVLDIEKMSAVNFIQDQQVDDCAGNQGVYEIVSVSDQAVLLEYQGEKWIYEIDRQRLHKIN